MNNFFNNKNNKNQKKMTIKITDLLYYLFLLMTFFLAVSVGILYI